MKILHVIPSVSLRSGGTAYAVRKMAEGLADGGVDVTVATTTSDMDRELKLPTGQYLKEAGVRYIYFPLQFPKGWIFSRPLARWLSRNMKDFDLAHMHSIFSYPTLPGYRAARKAQVPYIVRPAGMLDPYCLEVSSWKKKPYYAWIERHNLEAAAAIHAVSEMEGKNLDQLGFSEKMHIIPHGVDLPVSKEHVYGSSRGHSLELLFLSRLHPIKALPVLFKAVARLHAQGIEVRLTVAGDGEKRYESRLKDQARRLGIHSLVRFAGYVEDNVKDDLFRASDIFVLPSYHENFGIVVAEALSYGLPVILSDQVALAEETNRAGAGAMAPVDDSESLAAAILGFMDDEKRQAAGRNAIRLVRERFSTQAQIQKLVKLYESVIVRNGLCGRHSQGAVINEG